MPGRVVAVRVQDLTTLIWYSWDYGTWDRVPICAPGVGKLYVAFWIISENEYEMLDYTLSLIEEGTGHVLASMSGSVAPNEGMGIEWTGDMPAGNYTLTCAVEP